MAADGRRARSGPEATEPAYLRLRLSEAEAARDLAEAGRDLAEAGRGLAEAKRGLAEDALRRGRDDARFVLENIPQLVWRSRADGDWTWGGPQWTAFTGQSDPCARGAGWLHAVHPDDRGATLRAWAAASERAGGPAGFCVEHRLRRAADGAYRWFQTRAVPRHDQDGGLEWFGTSTDVHALKALQAREALLLAELRHRLRGSLARVRALVRHVGETDAQGEALELRLGGRLEALARVQSALIRDPFGGIDLRALLAEELRVTGIRTDGRVRLAGPRALLRPRAAEGVALALHELVTNAAAHGALGRAAGRLSVTWTVAETEAEAASEAEAGARAEAGAGQGAVPEGTVAEGTVAEGAAAEGGPGRPWLRLRWTETAPAPVAAAPRYGFGRTVLLKVLPRELGAHVTHTLAPRGLACRIDLPQTCRATNDGQQAEGDEGEGGEEGGGAPPA